MRAASEMVDAAIARARDLINEGKDPWRHEFECTNAEFLRLADTSWPTPGYAINFECDRICGLKIKVTG